MGRVYRKKPGGGLSAIEVKKKEQDLTGMLPVNVTSDSKPVYSGGTGGGGGGNTSGYKPIFAKDVAFSTPIPANPVLRSDTANFRAMFHNGQVENPGGMISNIDQYNASVFYADASTRRFSTTDPDNPLSIRLNGFGLIQNYRNFRIHRLFPATFMNGGRQHQFVCVTAGVTAGTAPNFAAATQFGQTVQDGTATWMHNGSWGNGGDPACWGDIMLNGPGIPVPDFAVQSPGTDGWLYVFDPVMKCGWGLWQTDITRDASGRITFIQCSFGSQDMLDGDGRSVINKWNAQNPWQGTRPDGSPAQVSRGSGAGLAIGGLGVPTWAELAAAEAAEARGDLENACFPHAVSMSTRVTHGPVDGPEWQYPATCTDGDVMPWAPGRYYGDYWKAFSPDNKLVNSIGVQDGATTYDPSKWRVELQVAYPIKEGQRFWLNITDAEIAGLATVWDRIWARTLKKYGVYCTDKGGALMSIGMEYPWSTEMKAVKARFGVSFYYEIHLPWGKLEALEHWNGLSDPSIGRLM